MQCERWTLDTPLPRTIVCDYCGLEFVVTDGSDKRMRFCCERHQELYWKSARRWDYKRRKLKKLEA